MTSARRACLLLALVTSCTGGDPPVLPSGGGGGGGDAPDGPPFTLVEPAEGQRFAVGEAVWVRGRVDEPFFGAAGYTVQLDLDGEPLDAAPLAWRGATFSAAYELPSGVHALSVSLADDIGTTTHRVQIVVDEDQPPSAPLPTITPASPLTGEALYLGYARPSVDPEGRPVAYDVQWRADGALQDGLRGLTIVPEGSTRRGQVWTVEVRASDGALLSEPGSASVQVSAAGPQIQVEITPDPLTVQDTPACSWTITEPDGDPIASSAALWRVNGQDAGDAAQAPQLPLARGDLLTCEVTARSTLESTALATVEVANSPPEVTEVHVTGTPATEAATLGCEGAAVDADGDAVTLSARWWVDGVFVRSAPTLDGADFDRDQEVVCELLGSDGIAAGAGLASDPVRVENSPPSAPVVSISPSAPVPGDLLTCAEDVAAADPDPNDALSRTWSWSVDGQPDTGASGATYDTRALLGGEVVRCQLTVDDGDASAQAEDAVVVGSRLEGLLTAADADVLIEGTVARAYLGVTTAGLGDVDGDGLPELGVVAGNHDGGRGALLLFSGAGLSGTVHDTDAMVSWEGDGAADQLGAERGLISAGDLDGDGLDDLWAAAWRASPGGDADAGEAYLLLSGDAASWTSGGSVADAAALRVRGDAAGDRLGGSLAAADLDGDGVNDLLVGAPLDDGAASNAGAVLAFLSPLTGSLSAADADLRVTGAAESDRLGYYGLEAVGDLDGDGAEDLALAAPVADGQAADAGVVYLVSAADLVSGDISAVAAARIEGLATDDLFGSSAAGVGDLDGDGDGELVIGARSGDAGATDAGSVHLFLGGPLGGVRTASDAAGALGGAADGDRLGTWVVAGDVDGDGVLDLVTGSPREGAGGLSLSGSAWLLPGSELLAWPSGGLVADHARASVFGEGTGVYLGRSPAVLGDVNGDGAAEWVVGAERATVGSATRGGQVLVFFGP